MWKVMIADDEAYMLEAMEKLIQKQSNPESFYDKYFKGELSPLGKLPIKL